ncbi:hypothetical protein KX729_28725 [Rhizobium sp. XQZ8]|uniref:DUF6894 family protein n=1 Tax=Rhizobium populisoli TaxID=2859785 RepID=UPI001CA57619|nr:hypothetical protein [Rhizobium populisoli]MBW6425414.1 hypothetical protein [Rhizobium populisoli]
MNRYFFHIRRSDGNVFDEEGDECANVEDARNNAFDAVRELIAAQIKSGVAISDAHMDVHNEAGTLQFSPSFHAIIQEQLKK